MQADNKGNERRETGFEIELGESAKSNSLPMDTTVLLKKQVQQQIDEFAASDTSRELGGILLGLPEKNDSGLTLSITAMLKAKKTAADKTSLTFTHETWDQIHHEKEILYPELKIVGWFHTHPGFGVFLSNYDLFIQQNFFNLPWQVAYVIDPVNKEKGFFVWEDNLIKASPYRVIDKDKEEWVALPEEEILLPAAIEEKDRRNPDNSTKWYKVILIVMGLLLIFTNLHRMADSGTDQELQETLLAKDRQVDTLRAELSRLQEKVASMQTETLRLEELVNQMSGEYFFIYTVMPGDTLWSISSRFYDDPSEHQFLMRLNDLENPDSLEVGQTLLLYKKGD